MTEPKHDNMVERVARAIAHDQQWPSWTNATLVARAAIKAMREPTEEMIKAGRITLLASQGMTEATPEGDAKWVWLEMIDSTLKD